MVTCFTEEELSGYLDGECPPGRSRLIRAHLKKCSKCAALYRKLSTAGLALEIYPRTALPPDREKGPCCFPEGTLAAYADGSLSAADERREIAAHIAGCDRCSRIVVEAARAADLARAAKHGKPDPVPARIRRTVEERFFPHPVSLGRIDISLAEIRDTVARWFQPGFGRQVAYSISPDYICHQAAEDRFSYSLPPADDTDSREAPVAVPKPGAGKGGAVRKKKKPSRPQSVSEPRPRKPRQEKEAPRWSFERGDIRVSIEVAAGEKGEVACRIEITDRQGHPLSGVPLMLGKAGEKIWTDVTRLEKKSIFTHLVPGRYRLAVLRENSYTLDLEVR